MNQEKFKIKLAKILLEVDVNYGTTRRYCSDYCVDTSEEAVVQINLSRNDIFEEARRQKNNTDPAFIEEYRLSYYENLALYRTIAEELLDYNILLIHGSAIAIDNSAFLFIAPSGTGKSTHTRLWREHFGAKALMVNDDKPLVRIEKDQVLVCGTPWNGKHHLSTNIQVPLKGIIFLERAEENSIERLSVEKAFQYLVYQTYKPEKQERMLQTLDIIDQLMEQVPIYKMKVNNFKEDAVKTACEGLGVRF